MIRHAISTCRKIEEFSIELPDRIAWYSFSASEGLNSLFLSCNCFQNKQREREREWIKKRVFVRSKILRDQICCGYNSNHTCENWFILATGLKLTVILWRLLWPCFRYFHILWWNQNIRNIHTTIKYLISPLATADYDEHFEHNFSHVVYFFFSSISHYSISNVRRNKTLAINILMKYSAETLTTMSDKVSTEINEGNVGEKLMIVAKKKEKKKINNFSSHLFLKAKPPLWLERVSSKHDWKTARKKKRTDLTTILRLNVS